MKTDLREKAILWAVTYHKDQVDKQGEPYIFHVLAVADSFKNDILSYVVAVLHDIVEDTECTLEEIQREFGITVEHQLKQLTHIKGQPYEEYINNLMPYETCRKIKIKDIQHNLSRLHQLEDEATKQRLRAKYTNALSILMNLDISYFAQGTEKLCPYCEGTGEVNTLDRKIVPCGFCYGGVVYMTEDGNFSNVDY